MESLPTLCLLLLIITGMTPGLGLDSGMTPGGLGHGGLTPAGLHHGGITPGLLFIVIFIAVIFTCIHCK